MNFGFAPLYHAHHSGFDEDLPFWLEMGRQYGDPVLELGCGSGRVLLPLARAGHRCVGLDNDLNMLRYLRDLTQDEAGGVHPPLLLQADMRHFRLAAQFGFALMPCNTLSALPDADRPGVYHQIAQHLRPGGWFAASLPNPLALLEMPQRGVEEVEEAFTHPETGGFVQVSSSWRRTPKTFNLTWHYDQLQADGSVERISVRTQHTLARIEQHLAELKAAGLEPGDVYGGFNGEAYSEESDTLVLTARRG